MPLCYGGGIRSVGDLKILFNIGIEKAAINTYTVEKREFISEAAGYFGSQSIVVSMDVRKKAFGRHEVFINGGQKGTGLDVVDFAKEMENRGAGELMLTSIDRDGTMQGYDMDLVKKVSNAVNIPVIACGGAGNIQDLVNVIKKGGASAAAAGSMFVFQGPHRAVMISYPSRKDLQEIYVKGDVNND
jgi:cyclase